MSTRKPRSQGRRNRAYSNKPDNRGGEKSFARLRKECKLTPKGAAKLLRTSETTVRRYEIDPLLPSSRKAPPLVMATLIWYRDNVVPSIDYP